MLGPCQVYRKSVSFGPVLLTACDDVFDHLCPIRPPVQKQSIGQLPQIADTNSRRIDVLDVSDNSGMTGVVPVSYSELLMLFAESTGLSGPDLPLFIDAITTTAAAAWQQESTTHNLSVCPAFQLSADENVVAATLDPAYDGYSLCTCNDG